MSLDHIVNNVSVIASLQIPDGTALIDLKDIIARSVANVNDIAEATNATLISSSTFHFNTSYQGSGTSPFTLHTPQQYPDGIRSLSSTGQSSQRPSLGGTGEYLEDFFSHSYACSDHVSSFLTSDTPAYDFYHDKEVLHTGTPWNQPDAGDAPCNDNHTVPYITITPPYCTSSNAHGDHGGSYAVDRAKARTPTATDDYDPLPPAPSLLPSHNTPKSYCPAMSPCTTITDRLCAMLLLTLLTSRNAFLTTNSPTAHPSRRHLFLHHLLQSQYINNASNIRDPSTHSAVQTTSSSSSSSSSKATTQRQAATTQRQTSLFTHTPLAHPPYDDDYFTTTNDMMRNLDKVRQLYTAHDLSQATALPVSSILTPKETMQLLTYLLYKHQLTAPHPADINHNNETTRYQHPSIPIEPPFPLHTIRIQTTRSSSFFALGYSNSALHAGIFPYHRYTTLSLLASALLQAYTDCPMPYLLVDSKYSDKKLSKHRKALDSLAIPSLAWGRLTRSQDTCLADTPLSLGPFQQTVTRTVAQLHRSRSTVIAQLRDVASSSNPSEAGSLRHSPAASHFVTTTTRLGGNHHMGGLLSTPPRHNAFFIPQEEFLRLSDVNSTTNSGSLKHLLELGLVDRDMTMTAFPSAYYNRKVAIAHFSSHFIPFFDVHAFQVVSADRSHTPWSHGTYDIHSPFLSLLYCSPTSPIEHDHQNGHDDHDDDDGTALPHLITPPQAITSHTLSPLLLGDGRCAITYPGLVGVASVLSVSFNTATPTPTSSVDSEGVVVDHNIASYLHLTSLNGDAQSQQRAGPPQPTPSRNHQQQQGRPVTLLYTTTPRASHKMRQYSLYLHASQNMQTTSSDAKSSGRGSGKSRGRGSGITPITRRQKHATPSTPSPHNAQTPATPPLHTPHIYSTSDVVDYTVNTNVNGESPRSFLCLFLSLSLFNMITTRPHLRGVFTFFSHIQYKLMEKVRDLSITPHLEWVPEQLHLFLSLVHKLSPEITTRLKEMAEHMPLQMNAQAPHYSNLMYSHQCVKFSSGFGASYNNPNSMLDDKQRGRRESVDGSGQANHAVLDYQGDDDSHNHEHGDGYDPHTPGDGDGEIDLEHNTAPIVDASLQSDQTTTNRRSRRLAHTIGEDTTPTPPPPPPPPQSRLFFPHTFYRLTRSLLTHDHALITIRSSSLFNAQTVIRELARRNTHRLTRYRTAMVRHADVSQKPLTVVHVSSPHPHPHGTTLPKPSTRLLPYPHHRITVTTYSLPQTRLSHHSNLNIPALSMSSFTHMRSAIATTARGSQTRSLANPFIIPLSIPHKAATEPTDHHIADTSSTPHPPTHSNIIILPVYPSPRRGFLPPPVSVYNPSLPVMHSYMRVVGASSYLPYGFLAKSASRHLSQIPASVLSRLVATLTRDNIIAKRTEFHKNIGNSHILTHLDVQLPATTHDGGLPPRMETQPNFGQVVAARRVMAGVLLPKTHPKDRHRRSHLGGSSRLEHKEVHSDSEPPFSQYYDEDVDSIGSVSSLDASDADDDEVYEHLRQEMEGSSSDEPDKGRARGEGGSDGDGDDTSCGRQPRSKRNPSAKRTRGSSSVLALDANTIDSIQDQALDITLPDDGIPEVSGLSHVVIPRDDTLDDAFPADVHDILPPLADLPDDALDEYHPSSDQTYNLSQTEAEMQFSSYFLFQQHPRALSPGNEGEASMDSVVAGSPPTLSKLPTAPIPSIPPMVSGDETTTREGGDSHPGSVEPVIHVKSECDLLSEAPHEEPPTSIRPGSAGELAPLQPKREELPDGRGDDIDTDTSLHTATTTSPNSHAILPYTITTTTTPTPFDMNYLYARYPIHSLPLIEMTSPHMQYSSAFPRFNKHLIIKSSEPRINLLSLLSGDPYVYTTSPLLVQLIRVMFKLHGVTRLTTQVSPSLPRGQYPCQTPQEHEDMGHSITRLSAFLCASLSPSDTSHQLAIDDLQPVIVYNSPHAVPPPCLHFISARPRLVGPLAEASALPSPMQTETAAPGSVGTRTDDLGHSLWRFIALFTASWSRPSSAPRLSPHKRSHIGGESNTPTLAGYFPTFDEDYTCCTGPDTGTPTTTTTTTPSATTTTTTITTAHPLNDTPSTEGIDERQTHGTGQPPPPPHPLPLPDFVDTLVSSISAHIQANLSSQLAASSERRSKRSRPEGDYPSNDAAEDASIHTDSTSSTTLSTATTASTDDTNVPPPLGNVSIITTSVKRKRVNNNSDAATHETEAGEAPLLPSEPLGALIALDELHDTRSREMKPTPLTQISNCLKDTTLTEPHAISLSWDQVIIAYHYILLLHSVCVQYAQSKPAYHLHTQHSSQGGDSIGLPCAAPSPTAPPTTAPSLPSLPTLECGYIPPLSIDFIYAMMPLSTLLMITCTSPHPSHQPFLHLPVWMLPDHIRSAVVSRAIFFTIRGLVNRLVIYGLVEAMAVDNTAATIGTWTCGTADPTLSLLQPSSPALHSISAHAHIPPSPPLTTEETRHPAPDDPDAQHDTPIDPQPPSMLSRHPLEQYLLRDSAVPLFANSFSFIPLDRHVKESSMGCSEMNTLELSLAISTSKRLLLPQRLFAQHSTVYVPTQYCYCDGVLYGMDVLADAETGLRHIRSSSLSHTYLATCFEQLAVMGARKSILPPPPSLPLASSVAMGDRLASLVAYNIETHKMKAPTPSDNEESNTIPRDNDGPHYDLIYNAVTRFSDSVDASSRSAASLLFTVTGLSLLHHEGLAGDIATSNKSSGPRSMSATLALNQRTDLTHFQLKIAKAMALEPTLSTNALLSFYLTQSTSIPPRLLEAVKLLSRGIHGDQLPIKEDMVDALESTTANHHTHDTSASLPLYHTSLLHGVMYTACAIKDTDSKMLDPLASCPDLASSFQANAFLRAMYFLRYITPPIVKTRHTPITAPSHLHPLSLTGAIPSSRCGPRITYELPPAVSLTTTPPASLDPSSATESHTSPPPWQAEEVDLDALTSIAESLIPGNPLMQVLSILLAPYASLVEFIHTFTSPSRPPTHTYTNAGPPHLQLLPSHALIHHMSNKAPTRHASSARRPLTVCGYRSLHLVIYLAKMAIVIRPLIMRLILATIQFEEYICHQMNHLTADGYFDLHHGVPGDGSTAAMPTTTATTRASTGGGYANRSRRSTEPPGLPSAVPLSSRKTTCIYDLIFASTQAAASASPVPVNTPQHHTFIPISADILQLRVQLDGLITSIFHKVIPIINPIYSIRRLQQLYIQTGKPNIHPYTQFFDLYKASSVSDIPSAFMFYHHYLRFIHSHHSHIPRLVHLTVNISSYVLPTPRIYLYMTAFAAMLARHYVHCIYSPQDTTMVADMEPILRRTWAATPPVSSAKNPAHSYDNMTDGGGPIYHDHQDLERVTDFLTAYQARIALMTPSLRLLSLVSPYVIPFRVPQSLFHPSMPGSIATTSEGGPTPDPPRDQTADPYVWLIYTPFPSDIFTYDVTFNAFVYTTYSVIKATRSSTELYLSQSPTATSPCPGYTLPAHPFMYVDPFYFHRRNDTVEAETMPFSICPVHNAGTDCPCLHADHAFLIVLLSRLTPSLSRISSFFQLRNVMKGFAHSHLDPANGIASALCFAFVANQLSRTLGYHITGHASPDQPMAMSDGIASTAQHTPLQQVGVDDLVSMAHDHAEHLRAVCYPPKPMPQQMTGDDEELSPNMHTSPQQFTPVTETTGDEPSHVDKPTPPPRDAPIFPLSMFFPPNKSTFCIQITYPSSVVTRLLNGTVCADDVPDCTLVISTDPHNPTAPPHRVRTDAHTLHWLFDHLGLSLSTGLENEQVFLYHPLPLTLNVEIPYHPQNSSVLDPQQLSLTLPIYANLPTPPVESSPLTCKLSLRDPRIQPPSLSYHRLPLARHQPHDDDRLLNLFAIGLENLPLGSAPTHGEGGHSKQAEDATQPPSRLPAAPAIDSAMDANTPASLSASYHPDIPFFDLFYNHFDDMDDDFSLVDIPDVEEYNPHENDDE